MSKRSTSGFSHLALLFAATAGVVVGAKLLGGDKHKDGATNVTPKKPPLPAGEAEVIPFPKQR